MLSLMAVPCSISAMVMPVLRALGRGEVVEGYGVCREGAAMGLTDVEAREERRFLEPEGAGDGGMSDFRIGGAMVEVENSCVTGLENALTLAVFVCLTVCVASGILRSAGIGTGWA